MLAAFIKCLKFIGLCRRKSNLRNMVHDSFASISNCSSSSSILKTEIKAIEDHQLLETYENAIITLNQLQSNFSTVNTSLAKIHNGESIHIQETIKFLSRINISLDDLDKLSVIHVSGTKGKGTTCSLVESILRSYGYRTGFFSSPHLVCVTERIRINGLPISRKIFTKHFWATFNRLASKKENEYDMPAYFNFLTVLAFKIFLKENVDVAIIEVGIGGEYDCTNVVRNTATVGITSLGLEHTRLLGNTLKEIAWQKAGIIKRGSNVFTTDQIDNCIDVIRHRCEEKQANKFKVVPNFDTYKWKKLPDILSKNLVQTLNASLAIQLALDWLIKQGEPIDNNELSCKITSALESSFWPGRCQEIFHENKRLLLDGAHTIESIELCSQWYSKFSNPKLKKILVFNTTGDRDSKTLLEILHRHHTFDLVLFTPNVASISKNLDNVNYNFPIEMQLKRCKQNFETWLSFDSKVQPEIFSSVEQAFNFIDNNISKNENTEILVTGSLHLIGAVVTTLDLYSHMY